MLCKIVRRNRIAILLYDKDYRTLTCQAGTRLNMPTDSLCLSCVQAQVIAQAIGQAFGVAYQQFLHANGIKASELRPSEYSDYLGTQEHYNGDLVHFSDSDNIREVQKPLSISASCCYYQPGFPFECRPTNAVFLLPLA